MKKLFSLDHSLELLATIFAIGAGLAVFYNFVFGKHFVIPTMWLMVAIFFGTMARGGMRDERWAKNMLFWIFLILACHTAFALVWAGPAAPLPEIARPGKMLGNAFYPVYGATCLVSAFLTWQYGKRRNVPG